MRKDLWYNVCGYKTIVIKAALTGLAQRSCPPSRALADVRTNTFSTVQTLLQANSWTDWHETSEKMYTTYLGIPDLSERVTC